MNEEIKREDDVGSEQQGNIKIYDRPEQKSNMTLIISVVALLLLAVVGFAIVSGVFAG